MSDFKTEGSWALLGVAGGAARVVHHWLQKDDGSRFPWRRFAANAAAAGFMGFMGGRVIATYYSESIALAAAGVGGYIGREIVVVIFNAWQRRVDKQ